MVRHRFVPVHLVPLSSARTDGFFHLFSFMSFMSFCLHVSSILSFSCAYYRPDLSLHTYTHAYSTYNEVQVAQVRYNEVWFIGCPSSLGSSSSATTHTFVCLVLFIFICPFCAHMCLASFPGRMEATHASLRGGVCVHPLESKGTFKVWNRGVRLVIPTVRNEATV